MTHSRNILPAPRHRQLWVQGALILGFWISFFMLTVGQRAIDPWGPQGLVRNEVLVTGIEYMLWLLLTPGVFWLSRRYSIEGSLWRRNLALHVAIALTVAVAINAVFHLMVHTYILDRPRPFSLTRSFLGLRFLDELIIYLTVLAAGIARDYFLRYQDRQRETSELRTQAAELKVQATNLQAQLSEARLQTLRMQINPHFLFNTLHTISTYLEHDPRGARRMIARLSDLLRYTLEKAGTQEVTLRQELSFLDGYLEIQRIRFQDSLIVEHDMQPEAMEALVPNLILQPLVENAVKHGVSAVDGVGRIEIRAWREGEQLHLSVADNGPGLAEGDGLALPPEGVGLRNTRERLESLYGKEQLFLLATPVEGGLVASVTIPYHTSADLYAASFSP